MLKLYGSGKEDGVDVFIIFFNYSSFKPFRHFCVSHVMDGSDNQAAHAHITNHSSIGVKQTATFESNTNYSLG